MDSYSSYLLRIGDNALILGQRLAEICGHGPVLEEDIALTNISLDLIGQARMAYQRYAELESDVKDEDEIAFKRDSHEFYNCLLVELDNGDFGMTIARQFFFSAFQVPYLEALTQSEDEFLRNFALKSVKEAKYHLKHSAQWMVRLGDGTAESHDRIEESVNKLWPYTGELMIADELDEKARAWGAPDLLEIKKIWSDTVERTLKEATLTIEAPDVWMLRGGKQGNHTEHLGLILAEMQFLQRAYPGLEW